MDVFALAMPRSSSDHTREGTSIGGTRGWGTSRGSDAVRSQERAVPDTCPDKARKDPSAGSPISAVIFSHQPKAAPDRHVCVDDMSSTSSSAAESLLPEASGELLTEDGVLVPQPTDLGPQGL